MSTTLKAAVLSAGAWSRSSHLPALAADSDVEIALVTSADGSRAREMADEFGATAWSTDWREGLCGDLDIAIVSSPPIGHEEQVVAALEVGAHVLVEKPYARTLSEARRMREAARAHARALLVGFGWVAAPVFELARSLVTAGELGQIELVDCHLDVNTRALLTGGTNGGWGGDATNPATYTDPKISAGGAAAVSMSHQLGLVSWILGERFTHVDATTFPPAAPIDLHVSSSLGLSGGGGAALSCASTHPYLARPQWHLGIYGSRAQLRINSIDDWARLVRASGEVVDYGPRSASGEYDPGAPTNALIDVARGAAPPSGMTADLATHVVAVTEGIYRSARTGQRLLIESVDTPSGLDSEHWNGQS